MVVHGNGRESCGQVVLDQGDDLRGGLVEHRDADRDIGPEVGRELAQQRGGKFGGQVGQDEGDRAGVLVTEEGRAEPRVEGEEELERAATDDGRLALDQLVHPFRSDGGGQEPARHLGPASGQGPVAVGGRGEVRDDVVDDAGIDVVDRGDLLDDRVGVGLRQAPEHLDRLVVAETEEQHGSLPGAGHLGDRSARCDGGAHRRTVRRSASQPRSSCATSSG